MKRFLVIVLGAMLIAGCTQKKAEEKAEWRSVDPMEFTTKPIDLLANRWMALCGLTVKYTELGNPYFDEGNLTIECKKLYADAFNMDLLPAEEREGRYTRMGIHTFYIGEIVNIWAK